MNPIPENLIQGAEHEAPEALDALDARGLIPAPNETGAEFAKRLRTLVANLERLEAELAEKGEAKLGGVWLSRDARMSDEVFGEAHEETGRLYGVRVDWVPGFFINPRFSWLFGGCAFYDVGDYLALFVIRRSFAERGRWLIYDRRELMAHELCHVARAALGSQVFEEHFAYRTATSRFRRVAGAVFRRPADTFGVLLASLSLVCAQMAQTFVVPALPVWPFWVVFAGIVVWLGGRLRRDRMVLAGAIENLRRLSSRGAEAAAFRLTDEELVGVAAAADAEQVGDCLPTDLRGGVIARRFGYEPTQQFGSQPVPGAECR